MDRALSHAVAAVISQQLIIPFCQRSNHLIAKILTFFRTKLHFLSMPWSVSGSIASLRQAFCQVARTVTGSLCTPGQREIEGLSSIY